MNPLRDTYSIIRSLKLTITRVMRFYARDAMPAPILASLYRCGKAQNIALATWRLKYYYPAAQLCHKLEKT